MTSVTNGIFESDTCLEHSGIFQLEEIDGELWLVCSGNKHHRRLATPAEKLIFSSRLKPK